MVQHARYELRLVFYWVYKAALHFATRITLNKKNRKQQFAQWRSFNAKRIRTLH
jgi:hypothetical protein